MTSTLDPQIRNRLTRFIHTGNEVPKYFPGCWASRKYFTEEKGDFIVEALANENNVKEIMDIIVKAYKDNYFTRYEPLAFMMTKCLSVQNPNVREAAYKAASQICGKTEQMLMLSKYNRLFNIGNGSGWRKLIKTWYDNKSPMELAKEVSRVKARNGRSHKILLRKSHYKCPENDHARDAVTKYVIFGLKRAKQEVGEKEGTKEVFDYIQKVEDLRHCEDPVAAAEMVTANQFTLDHVPGHFLTSQDVWDAVLPQFPLEELLEHIQRIHNMGFLTNDATTTAILVSLLSNQDIIKKSNVTPLAVHIVLSNYMKNGKPLKHAKAVVAKEKQARRRTRQIFDSTTGLWQWTVTKRHPKEIKHWGIDQPPNPAVYTALKKLRDSTWTLTQPTGARYLITMDMRHHMFKGRHFCKSYTVPKKIKKAAAVAAAPKPAPPPGAGGDAEPEKISKKRLLAECFHNNHVVPGHAAIILALQILKREKSVKIAVFTDEGCELVNIEKNFSNIEEAEFVLRKANLGRVQLDAPIEFMNKTNQKVDVFINMIDRATRYMELDKNARGGRGLGGRYGPPPPADKEIPDHCPVRALDRYRIKMKLPNSKMIVMSLASHRVATTDGSHEGVLDIVGIDEHVPKLMDAFVRGQFK